MHDRGEIDGVGAEIRRQFIVGRCRIHVADSMRR
jgi:hypothetical protein